LREIDKITPFGLLITLVLIYIFQGDKIITFPFHLILIVMLLVLYTYLIFALGYFGSKKLRILYPQLVPTYIGATFLNLR